MLTPSSLACATNSSGSERFVGRRLMMGLCCMRTNYAGWPIASTPLHPFRTKPKLREIRTLSFLLAALLLPAAAPAQSGDRVERLLGRLADAPGPPGFEEEVRRIVVREVKPLSDSVTYDGLGSVIAAHGSSGPRIMLDAHMDELGGIVRRVTPTGFLSMQMLGGWLDQALPDQRWMIIGRKGPVSAVTGIRDVHVVPPEERDRVIHATRSISTSARARRPRWRRWASGRAIRSCSMRRSANSRARACSARPGTTASASRR